MVYLTKLAYPIAIQETDCLLGGKNAGLSSPRRWRGNVAEYYQKGGFQNAIIFDSSGGRFEVDRIILKPLSIFDKIISSVTHAGSLSEACNVEMELTETGRLTLSEFCDVARDVALNNPSWWNRHSEQSEIETMFEDCTTFKKAIDSIGVLEGSNNPKPGKEPTNVVDQR